MGGVLNTIKAVAVGNRFMTDDGIAIAVLEGLRNKLEQSGIEVIIGEIDFQLQLDEFTTKCTQFSGMA